MATLETSITAGLAHPPPPNRRGDGDEVLWYGQTTDRKEYNGIEKETEARFEHVIAEAGKRPEA
jgi:hypothetical protein